MHRGNSRHIRRRTQRERSCHESDWSDRQDVLSIRLATDSIGSDDDDVIE
jgi:hypothetical protein